MAGAAVTWRGGVKTTVRAPRLSQSRAFDPR